MPHPCRGAVPLKTETPKRYRFQFKESTFPFLLIILLSAKHPVLCHLTNPFVCVKYLRLLVVGKSANALPNLEESSPCNDTRKKIDKTATGVHSENCIFSICVETYTALFEAATFAERDKIVLAIEAQVENIDLGFDPRAEDPLDTFCAQR